MDLNGMWQLAAFDAYGSDWQDAADPYPVAVQVPGEVHPQLVNAGIINDPLVLDNSKHSAWVEEKHWHYRRTFQIPAEFIKTQTFIEMEGLDTFGDVLLNGELLGQAENMFVPYRFNVTGKVRTDGENVLEVRFRPALEVVNSRGIDYESFYTRYNPVRLGARKMQASFGWDWMPRLIGAGIWQGVRIASYDRLSIRDLNITSEIEPDGAATVSVVAEIQNHLPESVQSTVEASVTGGEGDSYTFNSDQLVPAGGGLVRASFRISNARLWWPHGLGEQALYKARVSISSHSEILDEKQERFGIRKVELVERHEDGRPAFYFRINGQPVFTRGANWIPADAFPSQVTRARYERLLTLARDANCMMLRAWGGGVYETRDFYELCDEMGIMVWQDFQFSLAEYPDQDWLANSTAVEARHVIRRLRNHASLVLWCGNNECEMDTEADYAWPGKRFFHEIIPEALRELDPTRPYWPSSPYGGKIAHSSDYGDYHGEPWFHTASGKFEPHQWRQTMDADCGLFMSEFPTQGVPELESLVKVVGQKQLYPPKGALWDLHNQNNKQRSSKIGITSQEALVKMVSQMMGDFENAEQFAYFGGVLQGEFLKMQIDYYRRHKFDIGGSMFWCFNDAWPAVGYSVVDYYARPKPAYYFIKRAFQPVALVFGEHEDGIGAWVLNDSLSGLSGQVRLSVFSFGSEPVWQSIPVELPANCARLIWQGQIAGDASRQVAVGRLEGAGFPVSRATYLISTPKDTRFPQPKITGTREYSESEGLLTLNLETSEMAYALKLTGLPDEARPDDNYFDLIPGEPRTLTISNIGAEDADKVSVWRPDSEVSFQDSEE